MSSALRLVAAAARKLGIFVSRNPPYLSLEFHLRQLIDDFGIGLVVDVGAHHGEFAQTLRKNCGYRGRLVSFEPATEAFARLCAFKDPLWDRHQLALGSDEGTVELHIFESTVFNSVLQKSSFGDDYFELGQRGSEEVRIRKLDTVLEELSVDLSAVPSMIKIDTQGHDLAVLQGAIESVKKATILQCEVPVLKIYDGSPDFLRSLEVVGNLGFEFTGLFPVTRDAVSRVIEFDCVAVRVPIHREGSGHVRR